MFVRIKFLFLILGCIWLLPSTVAAQVQVEQKIDSVSILIGEQAHMSLSVVAPKGSKIVFPNLKPNQEMVPGIEILYISADTQQMESQFDRVVKTYTLTGFTEKLYALPALKVRVNGKTVQGRQLALKVRTVDVDTLHPNKFFPPKDVQDNPFQWEEWAPLFWASVLFTLLCSVVVYLYVRLKQNKPVLVKIRIVKKVPPHQKAMQAIDKIKVDRLSVSENQKEYYTMLTDVLRQYIKERFGFNALEMTSSEILYKLKAESNQTMLDELHELFDTADLVKFAKYSTLINENDLNLVNAVHFIDSTKLDTAPTEERIVPQVNEADLKVKKKRVTLKALIYAMIVISVALFCYIVYTAYQLMG